MTPPASRTTPTDVADASLGEIAWRNAESGESGHYQVKMTKCIIGSNPNASIVLPEPVGVNHVTLTFGKRFTLLKAPDTVLVGDRSVKEWLIDEPTEISVGPWQITILPARCAKTLANVVSPKSVGSILGTTPEPTSAAIAPVQPSPKPAAYMGDWTSEITLNQKIAQQQANFSSVEHEADLAALDAQRLEQVRRNLDKERQEYERLARERFEQEQLEQERLEQERLEQERLEQERLEQERLEQERLEQERLEQERLEQERLEQERLEQERLEQERLEQERLEQERLEQERLEQERLEQERLEQERLEQERLEQEWIEQERIAHAQLGQANYLSLQNQEISQLQAEMAEQHEDRIRAIELSIEQLRDGFESMRQSIAYGAQDNANLAAAFQEQLHQLSSNLAFDLQHQLHAQLEQRDEALGNQISKNLANIENHIASLGSRIESLTNEVSASEGKSNDDAPSELTSALFASLSGLEERLESIVSRMDEIAVVTSDNAQKIAGWGDDSANSVKAVEDAAQRLLADRAELELSLEQLRSEMQQVTASSQENYEYVLAQIQNFRNEPQSYLADQDSSMSVKDLDELHIQPSEEVEGRLDHVLAVERTRLSDQYNPADFQHLKRESDESYSDDYNAQSSDAHDRHPEHRESENRDRYTSDNEDSYASTDSDLEISERLQRLLREESLERESSYGPSEYADPNLASSFQEPSNFGPSSHIEHGYSDGEKDVASVLSQYGFDINESDRRPQADAAEPHSFDAGREESYEESRDYSNSGRISEAYSQTLREELSHAYQDPAELESEHSYQSEPREKHSESFDREESISTPYSRVESPAKLQDNHEDDEESIEAYMQQLLQRVKGGGDHSTPVESEPAKPSAPRSRADFLNSNRKEPVAVHLEEDFSEPNSERRILTQAEFTPRNQAPERTTDLNVLRELANNNARRAITTSDSKKTNSALLFKAAIVAVALVVGITILLIGKHGFTPATLSVIVSFAVAILWGYDCLLHMRKLGRNRSIIKS